MDPVQIRIDAEVADALKKILQLRQQFIDGKTEYKKALAEMQVATNNFTGDRLTRSATQYLAIIKQIGGVQSLTGREQAQVNKVLTETAEKYQRLGREIPQAMQAAIFATSQAHAKSQAELTKITQQLSGDKAVQAANQYVLAIQKVQDVNRLTEAQQHKVNKVLTEAAEVYRRLGVQVPPQMQAILDATTRVKPATDELKKLRDVLSGERSLLSANQYVRVIQEIGGVSKMSAEDQKKLLTTLNQLDARFTALGRQVPPEVRKIHDELKRLAPATDEVKKLMDRLSGREVISAANNYVQAISRMGGVTRLTKSEQQALNTTLTEAIAKYRALGLQAPRDMVNLLNATKAAGTETRNVFATTWADIAKGSLVGNLAANAIAAAWRGVRTAIREAAEEIVNFINRGSQVDRIASSFEKLIPANREIVAGARDVTRVTNEMIEAGRRGTLSLATDFEIMKAANQAVLFGIPLTAEKFETLSRAAVTLGRAMDLSAGKALNDLIIALGRSSPRILDNIGIIVKLVEAHEKHAKVLGKSRLDLTAEEKVIGFANEALRKMGIKVEEIGEIKLTAADKAQRLTVSFQNVRDETARIVAQSPVLNRAIEGIGETFAKAFGGDKEAMIRNITLITNQAAIIMVKGFDFALVAAASLTAGLGFLLAQLLKWKTESLRSTEVALTAALKLATALRPALGVVSDVLAASAAKALVDMNQLFGRAEDSASQFLDVIKGGTAALTAIEGMRRNTRTLITELEELAKIDPFKAIKQSAENLPRIVNNDLANSEGTQELSKAELAALKRNETFNISLDKQQEKFRAEYQAFLTWWEVAVSRWDRLAKKQNDASSQLLSEQNTHRVIDQFKKGAQALKDLDRDLLRGTIPFTEMLQKVWGISKDPGEDPSKWLKSEIFKKAIDSILVGTNRLAQSLQQLATVSGESFGKVAKSIAEVITVMNVGAEAGKVMNDGWDQLRLGASKLNSQFKLTRKEGLGQMVAGFANLASGVLAAASAIVHATDVAGKANRAMRGAATGAQIGAQLGGGYGAIAGAIIGAIVGVLRKPMWEQAMKRVGHDLGAQISEGLGRQIEKDAKEKFGKDLFTAETFNLRKIIDESFGVSDKNFDRFLNRLQSVFPLIQQGRLTTEQGRKILDENFGLFAEHLEKSGKLASDQMIQFIALNRQFGTESKQIQDFLLKTSSSLGGALSKMLNDSSERYKGLSENIQTAKDSLNEINAEIEKSRKEKPGEAISDDLLERQKQAQEKLSELLARQNQGRAATQEEFERLGRLTLTAYNGMVREGLTAEEIAERLGPAWSRLLQLQKDLGIETQNAALKSQLQLERAKELNPTIFEGAAAVNQATVAYHNMGEINQETFEDLEDQMQEYFTRLQSTGITQRQVLEQNIPFLLTAIDLERRKKVTLDDTTKEYIRQAQEMGLLKEGARSNTEVMAQGFQGIMIALEAVIKALGGDVPAALRQMIDAARRAAGEVDESVGEDVPEAAGIAQAAMEDMIAKLMEMGFTAQTAASMAIQALQDMARAAQGAGNEVTGIAEGFSPGGFRGIIDRAHEAKLAVRDFAANSIPVLEDMFDQVNRINPGFGSSVPPGLTDPSRIRLPEEEDIRLENILKDLASRPTVVIEDGAIQNHLSAWGIADKEQLEAMMAQATLEKIWEIPALRGDFFLLARQANR
jgi:predicted transcriptional regulator